MFHFTEKRYIIVALIFSIFLLSCNSFAFSQTQPDIKSSSAILMDAGTGKVLYEKNPHEKMEQASITKIMTLLLALEAVDAGKVNLNDKVKVSERAWKTGGSQVFLGAGEEQSLETLLKCIAVASANDASVAVAEYIGGSVDGFVKMMNEKAKELGMKNTNFVNPHGLSDPNHYSTAYDIALMSKELVKHKKIFSWSTIWMDELEHTDKEREPTMLANTNKLIGKYEGLDGLKTGFHSKAGFCFAGTAKRGNLRLISVVLNAENSKQRFEDTIKLLDYGFGNFDSIQIAEKGSVQKTVFVEKGSKNEVNIVAADDLSYLIEKGKAESIKTKLNVPEKLIAPLNKGQKVGQLVAEHNGKIIGKVDLVVSENISKIGMFDIFKKVVNKWFNF